MISNNNLPNSSSIITSRKKKKVFQHPNLIPSRKFPSSDVIVARAAWKSEILSFCALLTCKSIMIQLGLYCVAGCQKKKNWFCFYCPAVSRWWWKKVLMFHATRGGMSRGAKRKGWSTGLTDNPKTGSFQVLKENLKNIPILMIME